jgi:Tol biopolymer transport system component
MHVDGSQKTRLTKAEYWDGSPEITPDGKSILFHSRRSDMMESGICIMDLDGSNQKVLSKVGTYPVACK